MGSPLSPVIANIFIKNLEERALNTAILRPNMWFRYVDDTFVTWTHGDTALRKFHQHLSQQSPSIQFTMEEEKDDQLPFLDVLVCRAKDKLRTSVYRRPTHTDSYIKTPTTIPEFSEVQYSASDRDRVYNVCDETSRTAELKHLHNILVLNGYPTHLTRGTLRRKTKSSTQEQQRAVQGTPEDERKNACSFLIFEV